MTASSIYKIIVYSQREEVSKRIKKVLEQYSFKYCICKTYQEVLGKSEGMKQCILIADFRFKNFDGLTVIKRIRKDFDVFPPAMFVLNEYDDDVVYPLIKEGVRDFIYEGNHLEGCVINRLRLLIAQLEREKNSSRIIEKSIDFSHINKITNLVEDIVFIRDHKGRLLNINDSGLLKLKYNLHELMIMDSAELVAPHAIYDYQLEFNLLKEKKQHIYQTELISKDKTVIPVEVSSSISTYQGMEVIVSIARDISDRLETNEKLKHLNADLERINEDYKIQNSRLRSINREIEENRHALKLALKEAENAEKLKNKFLANMSHEIRTPMNAVVGFSQLLEDADPEDVPDFVRIINNNSETLLQLINDLMDIAKIESDLVAINTNPLNVHDLLMDLKTIFNYEKLNKGKKNIKIIYHPPAETNIEIETDKLRLKQVLMNLMNNALKFTEEGSVEIGFDVKENGVQIFVKDTGIGIPIKMQQQIFERFHQIEYGTKPQGTGIGLSISRSLIRLLGGEIEINSKVNKGSEFIINHPFSQIGNKRVKPPQKNMVMIAEDEEDNYHLLKYVMKDLNLEVIWAKNGQEAVDLCREKDISLVLMDIKMPTKSGLEATREILEFQPSLPIIAQTAYTQVEDIERCRKAGCLEFISKPINLTHLRRTIAKYI
jgi:PAS domain S-box-containing protein